MTNLRKAFIEDVKCRHCEKCWNLLKKDTENIKYDKQVGVFKQRPKSNLTTQEAFSLQDSFIRSRNDGKFGKVNFDAKVPSKYRVSILKWFFSGGLL